MVRGLIGACLVLLLVMTGALFLVNGGRMPRFSLVLRGQPASSSSEVVGPPSISSDLIDRVLFAAGSPALGKGQALYNLGVRYGIDPAYALAFFQHESGYGRSGVAKGNRSLGNIRCTAGYVCREGFRSYLTWEAGFEDWYRLISGPVYVGCGLTTVEQIIPKYAPTADKNDVWAYINAINRAVTAWRAGQVYV